MEAGIEHRENSESKKNPFNPHTLNSNDNPSNLIIQMQLKGENYEEWTRAMQTALIPKMKYGFVNGSVKQLEDDAPKLKDW